MRPAFALLSAACLLAVSGCTAPAGETDPPAPAVAAAAPEPALWTFAASADAIRAASCEGAAGPESGLLPLELQVTAIVDKQAEGISARLPAGARLSGAWDLSSPDPNFGGVSGLSLADDKTLLGVTDAGGWVKIALDAGAPASAAIGYMRGADGTFLSGKGEADAEGLAYRDGIAVVSFERDFRVEAFALGTCGAAAKAVEIAALPSSVDGAAIGANEGPEAVLLTPAGELRFGFEASPNGASPIGRVLTSGEGVWSGEKAGNPAGFALVSMERVRLPDGTERDITLFRAFDPIRGARSVLVWGDGDEDRLTLARPALTDNFEGLAVQPLGEGEVRLWIVADNNFSSLQRTLLYAVDVRL